MKLLDLEPHFLRFKSLTTWRRVRCRASAADGIIFVCPKCFRDNGMKRPGVHSVICWTPKVPAEADPGPGRWSFEGEGLHDLTLVAGSSSILLTSGCQWHGFIRNGQIVEA